MRADGASGKQGKGNKRPCCCEFKCCQRNTNNKGTGVRMVQDAAEAFKWYKELCPDQPDEVLRKLVAKRRSPVAIQHFEDDGLYRTASGQLRKTDVAFPGRYPSKFAAGHKWATSKKQSGRPHWKKRREQALLAATVSPAVQRLDWSRQEVRDEVSELKLELELERRVGNESWRAGAPALPCLIIVVQLLFYYCSKLLFYCRS